jgi:ribosomal protein S27AE
LPWFACMVLSHGPMLDPSEATRKPSDGADRCAKSGQALGWPSRSSVGKGEAVSKTKTVAKQTPLRCPDCGHEFDALAVHKERYVERGRVLARTAFDRALDDCPVCGSHRVAERP